MQRINHPLAVRPAERQRSRRAPSCRRFTLYGDALPEELIGALEPIQLRRLPRRGNGTTERACYLGKLSTQDANGTTTMAYNLLGAMTSLTDPDQNQTVWTRDNLGRVIAEQNPSGSETFAYDANSNLVKQVDFDGHERDFVFDDLNRETAEKWINGATVLNTISTAYNADGEVTSTGDNCSDYAFGYNGQGDQTSVDNAGTPGAPHVVLTSQFDALGNRTSLAATLNGTADFINNYSYDTLSRLRDITQQGQTGGNAVAPKSIYIGLNGVGDITELNYANSVDAGPQQTSPGYVTLTYSSTTGLLTAINDTANGASIDNLAYTYDALGRVSTFSSIDGTATYGYDHTSQLVAATYTTATGGHQPANVNFTWDANGNNAAPGNVVSPNNEVTNDGTYTYTFDADGNRTTRTAISTAYATDHKTTYTWDYRNRLTDVEFFDNNNVLTKHVHYVYDVYDNLLEEDIDPNGGGTYTTKEQFVLDVQAKTPAAGNAPLERFDVSGNLVPLLPDDVLMELVNNQLTERFLNGPSPSGAADVIYAEGAVASLTQPDSVDWIFANNQGSPTDVVNSSGTLIEHRVYSAFGQVAYVSNAAVFVLQGFSGGFADSNTGLVKFGERWYDPLATVWISVDPAGFRAADQSLTTYAGNTPTNCVDPTGLQGFWDWWYGNPPLEDFAPPPAPAAGMVLPSDPTGLTGDWTCDPTHRYPNGTRFRHPNGDYLDWHPGQPGKPGWGGRDHWHHNGGEQHLRPGDVVPDPGPVEATEEGRNPKYTAVAIGGCIVYFVISEGSRVVFPLRNLIPVW